MKNIKNKILSLVIIYALVTPMMMFAATFSGTKNYFLPLNEIINDNLYAVAENVNISGQILGDSFLLGNTIFLNSTSSEDIIAAGGEINIMGSSGDVILAGDILRINSQVNGDLILAAKLIDITSEALVKNSVIIYGENISVRGKFLDKAKITGNSVFLDGVFDKDIIINANNVTFGKNIKINGNLTYNASEIAEVESGAELGSNIKFIQNDSIDKDDQKILSWGFLLKILILICSVLILHHLFRNKFNIYTSVDFSYSNFGKSLSIGFLFLMLTPMLAIILLISVLGVWLGLILILLYVTCLVLAYLLTSVIVGMWLNKFLFKDRLSDVSKDIINWKIVCLGVFILELIGFIPVIGWIIKFILMIFSLGFLYNMISNHIWLNK